MRRLAAVLIADCFGYSRMMQADELGTFYAVKALRADVLGPFAAECGGRVVKGTGDGVLAEFKNSSTQYVSTPRRWRWWSGS